MVESTHRLTKCRQAPAVTKMMGGILFDKHRRDMYFDDDNNW